VHDVSAYRVHSAGNSVDENRQNVDYLAAPKGSAGSKRNSLVLVKTDGDPAFDLRGARTPAAGGGGDDLAGHGHNTSGELAPYTNGSVLGKHGAISSMDAEESKWIHRDKLAQIEGNEAADYLYDVRKSQWIHKDKLERIEIEELQRAGAVFRRSQGDDSEGGDGKPVASPVGSEESDRHPYSDDFEVDPHDLRTPEEQAMARKAFRRNPSYSRIPLASVSPHPIPQQFLERTTPLPRTIVTPNGSDDGASPGLPMPRKRSYSAGSAMVLEASENALSGTAGTPSPATGIHNPKIRSASGAPGGPRRASGSRSGSLGGKQRTRSNPQLYHRPGTAASHATHYTVTPGSANKNPEGQPPWALASYKPDPSLPQDQQIIPTLAKRLQQEQWERDGVYASVYDRELRPLKVLDDEDAEKGENGESSKPKDEWPLKSPRLSGSPAPRQKSEQVTDGGYRIVPNVSFPVWVPSVFPTLSLPLLSTAVLIGFVII
jgi:hypothetical protein